MKCNGVQVEEHGSGFAITLRLHVGSDEIDRAKFDIDLVGFLKSFARGIIDGRIADSDVEEALAGKADPTPAPTAEPSPSRARRGGKKTSAGATDADDKKSGKSAAGSPGARRVNRGDSKPADPDTTEAGALEGKGAVDPTPANASSPSATGRSRSKTTKGGKSSAPTAGKSRSKKGKVTDEDLTKTASLAAADLGAPAVMDVVAEFDVEKVGDLDEKQRVKFVARIAEEREKANA